MNRRGSSGCSVRESSRRILESYYETLGDDLPHMIQSKIVRKGPAIIIEHSPSVIVAL